MSFPLVDPTFRYIDKFEYIAVTDILTFPPTTISNIKSPIVLRTGAEWQVGYSRTKKLKYNDKSKTTKSGTIFNQDLSGTWAGSSIDIDAEFFKMLNEKFVLKVTNTQNEERILGTKETPLSFTFSHMSEIVEGIEGYSYKFSGNSFQHALLYMP